MPRTMLSGFQEVMFNVAVDNLTDNFGVEKRDFTKGYRAIPGKPLNLLDRQNLSSREPPLLLVHGAFTNRNI